SVYLLQIGALELQRGNWDKARRYFERADAVFPGYWLAQAHVAQMDAAKGDLAAAEKSYLRIIERTDNPDVMAALVTLYKHQGRIREAAAWAKRAGTIWDKRVSLLPETYYDHAFDHAMDAGDVKRALALAQQNYSTRPYGDAAIGLARALVANGKPGLAVSLLEKQEKAGWRSVELFAAMMSAYEAAGRALKVSEAKEKALEISPKAFVEAASLLAFGNH
uniref:tetratricopeptide repeat protein n=1 Tax=Parasphingorhabdus sp. TaxID=2709688 RepID=UPI0035931458